MRPKTLKFVKRGDQLTVQRWNELIDAVNRAGLNLGQDSGLDAQFTPHGTALRVTRQTNQIYRGVVTTAIPTGTISTPSTTGEITIYDWDGTNSTAGQTGVQVFNDFTLSASVPINTVVKVCDIDGSLWLLASECY